MIQEQELSETGIEIELPEIRTATVHHIGFSPRGQGEEDASLVQLVNTAGGLLLNLGMVADGYGGVISGKPAARFIIDQVVKFIQTSTEMDVNAILADACQKAHQVVLRFASSGSSRSSRVTLTIAVIEMYNMELFIAHVGENCAYLYRRGAIAQLTAEHTEAGENERRGLPRAAASTEPVRYLGQLDRAALVIDQGVRLEDPGIPDPAEPLPSLLLEPGDVIILCSNGLVGRRGENFQPVVRPEEILSAVRSQEPEMAANSLVRLALDRQVPDNVSLSILETPGKRRPLPVWIWAILAVLIVGAFSLWAFNFFRQRGGQVAQSTPTGTPVFTDQGLTTPDFAKGYARVIRLEPGQLFAEAAGWQSPRLAVDSQIPTVNKARISSGNAPAELALSDGTRIFLDANTILYVDSIVQAEGGISTLTLDQGVMLVVGSKVRINSKTGAYGAVITAGAMGIISPSNTEFIVNCLDGVCDLSSDLIAEKQQLGPGQRSGFSSLAALPVSQASYSLWAPYAGTVFPAPTATPTPLPTRTPTPTRTPPPAPQFVPTQPSGGGGGGGGGGGPTPIPAPPTATPDAGGG